MALFGTNLNVNANPKGYHMSEYKIWFDPCQEDAEHC